MAKELARLTRGNPFYEFTEIWCSPYLRARQTAEPFLKRIKDPTDFKLMDCLVPHGNPADVVSQLQHQQSSVLVVGHNPHLSFLARMLLGTDGNTAHQAFKKGALFVFKRDPFSETGFALSGYLPPAALDLKS
jgi:phosphohistidine phosphatase